MKAGRSIVLPDAVSERAVYVVGGELKESDTVIPACSMVVFTNRKNIKLTAIRDSRIVLIGGEGLGDRYIWWNFVSSRKERIEQAKRDWKDGRFAKVFGDEHEFIPLPD